MALARTAESARHVLDSANLSPREHDILLLLGQGLANQKIARQLTISERTVKAHITSILHKLGLESRLQAGLFAARLASTSVDEKCSHCPKVSWCRRGGTVRLELTARSVRGGNEGRTGNA